MANDDPDYRAYYDNTYVRAWDLPVGRDAIMVIERVERVEIEGQDKKKQTRPLVYFRGARKGMVLNKGMGKTIKGIYGARVSGWIGQPIALYATVCTAFGEDHDVIRVRPTAPAVRKPRNAPDKPAARELSAAPIADAEIEHQPEDQEIAS